MDRTRTGAPERPAQGPRWVRLSHVTDKYAVSRTTLWRWRRRYGIGERQVGGVVFINEDDVVRLIEGSDGSGV